MFPFLVQSSRPLLDRDLDLDLERLSERDLQKINVRFNNSAARSRTDITKTDVISLCIG